MDKKEHNYQPEGHHYWCDRCQTMFKPCPTKRWTSEELIAEYGKYCGEDKPTLYTIKPLEWKETKSRTSVVITTHVTYWVDCTHWGYSLRAHITGNNYNQPCTSIEDGKAQVKRHYEKQLGKCLVVYDG